MKLNNQQGIVGFNAHMIATQCSERHIQSVLEDCQSVMKECEYWIWRYTKSPNDAQVKVGLENCLKALRGEL